MKVISLNIRHGGGARVPRIIEYLLAQAADVIVLTEFRENAKAPAIREALLGSGFIHTATAPTSGSSNSVGIWSRSGFEQKANPGIEQADAHRLVSARLGRLEVHGVYFAGGKAKASLFDYLLQLVRSAPTQPTLVVGDFNTGLFLQDESGSTFFCADRFGALCGGDLIDCWRSRNPRGREFTWYSHAGNGFRIDHALASSAMDRVIRDVRYDHTPRIERITDHSALIVELDEYAIQETHIGTESPKTQEITA